MPTATPGQPVFIDQTPDYQQAVANIMTLAAHKPAFTAAAQDLGLSSELTQAQDALAALQPKAAVLEAQENALALQAAQIERQAQRTGRDAALAGGGVVLTSSAFTAGAVALAAGRKNWRLLKGAAAGAGAAILTGLAWLAGTKKIMAGATGDRIASSRDILINQALENQLLEQGRQVQDDFIGKMATRMLEQQKTLLGQGAEMRVVPDVEIPMPPMTMAGKYAVAPAASKAEAIMDEKTACALAAR